MKKFKQLFAVVMVLAGSFFVASCDDEETPAAPTVTTSSTVTNVVAGQAQTLTFSVVSAGGFKSATVAAVGGTASITTPLETGAKEGDIVVTFTAGAAAGAGSVTVVVTDNSNQIDEATSILNITLPDGPALTGPTSVTAVKINEAKDITIPVTVAGGFKSATVTDLIGGTAVVKSAPAVGATSGDVVVTFTAGSNAGAGSVKVTVTDNNNKSSFAVVTLNISLDAPPTLVLNKTTAQANAGATVTVQATITAANGGKQLSITGIPSSPASPILFTETSKIIDVTLTVPNDATAGSKIIAAFVATDSKDLNTAPQNVEITVTAPNTIIVPAGTISANTTWTASNKYVIQGQVFVASGFTLTVEPGTVVVGEKSSKGTLIIQPGGKLMAEGTAANPIVFTSNQPVNARDRGDWGGIVWLGNAYVNQATRAIEGISPSQTYGNNTSSTTNADENSGSMKYVRIEYAGIELSPNNETNSLTMGGLGNGTTIDYVQVSFGGDDGFEWFGGTVNAKHLVSFSTWDDDFDTDFGFAGNVQFGLVVRNPFFADQSGSNAFESDNQGNGNSITGCDATSSAPGTITSCTRPVFSNITVLGPRETNSRSISASYQNALHIRRRSSISIFNSFISGFRIGLRIDDDGTYYNLAQGNAKHANNVLSNSSTAGIATSTTATDGTYVTGIRFAATNDGTITTDAAVTAGNATSISNYWLTNNTAFNNVTTTSTWTDLGISSSLFWAGQSATSYPSDPDFVLVAGVAGPNNLNSGAAFTDAKITGAGSFFETTTYRGAFGASDWTNGWSEFRPIAKAY